MSQLGDVEVTVADRGVDALLIDRDGMVPVLFLRPGQTHDSAVRAVARVAPRASTQEIRTLVRDHLPEAVSLEDLLRPAPPPVTVEGGRGDARWVTCWSVAVAAVVIVLLSIGFWVLHADVYRQLGL